MVTTPDVRFDGVSSSLAEFMSILFFSNFLFIFLWYYVRNPQAPQTTDSTRAVQGACCNQLATTLYKPAACQRSRKQHHTRSVVCPRCITTCGFLVAFVTVSDPAICRPAGLLLLYIHAATGTTTQIQVFHNVVIWYHMRMIQYRIIYVFPFVLAPLP